MRRARRMIALIVALSACGGPPAEDPDAGQSGTVSGTLNPFVASRAHHSGAVDAPPEWIGRAADQLMAQNEAPGTNDPSAQRWPLVESELVLGVAHGDPVEVVERLHELPSVDQYRFEIAAWGGPDVLAIRIRDAREPARALGREETLTVRRALLQHPALAYVEPNWIRVALRRPDDEHYGYQWHYPGMNLEAAWDETTGSSSVVVAVIDDGVNPHPDLDARVLPGRDMVSDAARAGDGDERDSIAHQVPGGHGGYSVWHGTHVAGTIGAISNNGMGVAGVDWSCRILPVRALDREGSGSSIDIIAAMNWASGIGVPGEPSNSNPARVINMSLGGGPLSSAEQEAVNQVVARNVVIVVAAGNDDQDARSTSYAGYDNVIVVGATDLNGRRARYSNYGTVVDVMAPGGDSEADVNGDGIPDGVVSTWLDTAGSSAGFEQINGTSMAAPHIAGLAALMISVAPSIAPSEVERILRETASASSRCTEGCGAGLANAAAAVRAARGGVAPTDEPRLELSASAVNLGETTEGTVLVFNAGGGALTYAASFEGAQASSFAFGRGQSATVAAGGAEVVSVIANRGGLADGSYEAVLRVASNGGERTVPVRFRVGSAATYGVGTVFVGAVVIDEATDEIIVGGETTTDASRGFSYSFACRPGVWAIVAFNDPNENGTLDDGELLGFWRNRDDIQGVTVAPGGAVSGIDFALQPIFGTSAPAAAPCADLRACFEGCGSDEACADACPIQGDCDRCIGALLSGCGASSGCGAEGGCLCASCQTDFEGCFGAGWCAP